MTKRNVKRNTRMQNMKWMETKKCKERENTHAKINRDGVGVKVIDLKCTLKMKDNDKIEINLLDNKEKLNTQANLKVSLCKNSE